MAMRKVWRAILYWVLVVLVSGVMGAPTTRADAPGAVIPGPYGPTWIGHWDVVQAIITMLFGAGVWFAVQKLNSIDKKFDLIFQWRYDITKQVTKLQSEHDLLHPSVPHHPLDD